MCFRCGKSSGMNVHSHGGAVHMQCFCCYCCCCCLFFCLFSFFLLLLLFLQPWLQQGLCHVLSGKCGQHLAQWQARSQGKTRLMNTKTPPAWAKVGLTIQDGCLVGLHWHFCCRTLRVWSLKDKCLLHTLRGHDDDIEVSNQYSCFMLKTHFIICYAQFSAAAVVQLTSVSTVSYWRL